MKMSLYLLTILIAFAASNAAFATDFIAPSNCGSVTPTGGASSDLATEGDPPVVEMYLPRWTTGNVPAEVLAIQRDSTSGDWQIYAYAPAGGQYYIQAVYTPFLQTFQTIDMKNGESKYITLARLTNGTPGHPTASSLEVNIGSKYAGGFVEFAASIGASEPFTMQLDQSGKVMVYCLAYNVNGYPVTVYNAEHEFVGTGEIGSTGAITWDQ